MYCKVLGAYGSKYKNKNTVSFQIAKSVVIDAGNIINGVENIHDIKHIIISHSHIDHIQDLPYLIDLTFSSSESPLNIYATKECIATLKEHIFNDNIWPEFQNINLPNSSHKAINFITLTPEKPVKIEGVEVLPFEVDHTPGSLGFLVDKSILISGDTAYCENLVKTINKNRPKYLFLETSFPNSLQNIADISKHMTPNDIKKILKELEYSPEIYIYHLKPQFENEIKNEFEDLNVHFAKENLIITNKETTLSKGIDEIVYEMIKDLYTESDINKILNKIVTYAREITNSDAASLYLKTEDDQYLEFKIVQNKTLNVYLDKDIPWPKLNLYKENGEPNETMVAALCALKGEIITIDDAYNTKEFDFEGTKRFDRQNNYRSKSMLVIPLKNHENEIIGVLQLINKYSENEIVSFNEKDKELVYLLASIAAVSLTKNKLIEDFEKLLTSLIQTIGLAIDEKSKYTGGHVQRVAKLALMLAKAVEKENIKHYSNDELKMMEIAGWLHDIGKIATPEYVMNKATKLHLFKDLIDYLKYKFELAKAYRKIDLLQNRISQKEYDEFVKYMDESFEFVKKINKGSEFTSKEDIAKLQKLTEIKIASEPLINEEEFKNLSVQKGTLTEEERRKIEEHALIGLKMLKKLHFPKKFKKLPEIAANHHEKLNCKGYPRQLCENELSLEERIMAVADIFEALSAADRPYKEPKKMSEIFKILYFMAKDKEIDKEIIKLMIKHKVYEEYGKKELKSSQLDTIPKELEEYFLN